MARQPSVPKLIEELAIHPDRLELILAIDLILTKEGRLNEANVVFQDVDRVAPGMLAEFLQLREQTLGNLGGSIEELKVAVKNNPDNLQVRIGVADILRAHGSVDDALSLVEDFPNPTPDQLAFLANWKARALIEAGRLDDAERHLEPYLGNDKLPPPELQEVVGEFLGSRGRIDEQLQYFRRLGDSEPTRRMSSKYQVIQLLLHKKQPQEALREIEELAARESLPSFYPFPEGGRP